MKVFYAILRMFRFVIFSAFTCTIGYELEVYKSIELRRYLLDNGNVLGMLKTFWNPQLRNVQVFKDIQFASNERAVRFGTNKQSGTVSLSQLNIFSYNNSYGVCPQRDWNEIKMKDTFPLLFLEQIRRKTRFIIKQNEKCLLFNLYVPVLGEYTCFQIITFQL